MKFANYFFNGIKVIANNKLIVILIFAFIIILLQKNETYKEEIKKLQNEYIEEKTLKTDTVTKYYYNEENNTTIKKDIAASTLVNCINNKIDINNINENMKNIINELNNLFNQKDEYFSFLYKDIYTGFTVSYNKDGAIFTASSIKAPAMIYLYEKASENKIDLTEKMTYTNDYYSNGSGVLKNKEFNTQYTIDTLIQYSIHDSDNAAYKMLMNKYKRENILNFWKEKGTKNIFTQNTIWGTTSANDAEIYLQELYNFYLENEEYGSKLMNYFKNAEWKIITNKDNKYNTANKGGWSGTAFHDIAIVFEENPYMLIIMSNTGESDYTYLFSTTSKLVGNLHEEYWKYKIETCNNIKQY